MLSVVIVAWNEEKKLPRVVSSVKKIADEIVVVVDEDSTDKTLAVAKKLKCKVFTHPHTGIVEPMRNWAIDKAKGDWVLMLDADEEVTGQLANKIKEVMDEQTADYFRIPRKNLIFNKWIKSEHWWPDYVYRLFRKGHIEWDDTIHSVPFTRGKGADIKAAEELAIVHHHYESVSQYVDRLNRYTDHQVQHLLDAGYSFSWVDVIGKPFQEFLRQYFARKGYSQGLHGLALAGLQAFSELVLYLKMWQQSGFVPVDTTLVEVQQAFKEQSQQARWWWYQVQIDTSPWLFRWVWKLRRKVGL